MNVLVVIPCYNHSNYLPQLLKKLVNNNVLIIDDGSDINISLQNHNDNIVLIRNDVNKGKGYSIKKAAKFARRNNYTHIVTIDSDLQHNVDDLKLFISKAKNCDLVYGYRSNYKKMPLLRIFSNKITSFMISSSCSKKIYDSQCGYRMYNLSLFEDLLSNEDGYQFESEILLKKINNESIIDYVEIKTVYNNSLSHFSNISDTFRFIKMYIKHYI